MEMAVSLSEQLMESKTLGRLILVESPGPWLGEWGRTQLGTWLGGLFQCVKFQAAAGSALYLGQEQLVSWFGSVLGSAHGWGLGAGLAQTWLQLGSASAGAWSVTWLGNLFLAQLDMGSELKRSLAWHLV